MSEERKQVLYGVSLTINPKTLRPEVRGPAPYTWDEEKQGYFAHDGHKLPTNTAGWWKLTSSPEVAKQCANTFYSFEHPSIWLLQAFDTESEASRYIDGILIGIICAGRALHTQTESRFVSRWLSRLSRFLT